MSLVFLSDPSFWILVSFILLIGVLSRRILKNLGHQLKTRQETIARQILEVSSLYEEARALLLQEKETLKEKEQEVFLIKEQTIKEVKQKKVFLKNNIEKIHQKYEKDLHQKMHIISEKYMAEVTKKMLQKACLDVEKKLGRSLEQKTSQMLIKKQIEKMCFTKTL